MRDHFKSEKLKLTAAVGVEADKAVEGQWAHGNRELKGHKGIRDG